MKLSLYFLFYVAMVLELLIFIVDRDDAQDEINRQFAELAASQVQTLTLSGPQLVTVIKGQGRGVEFPIAVTGFWRAAEKEILRPVVDGKEYQPRAIDTVRTLVNSQKVRIETDKASGGFKLKVEGSQDGRAEITMSVLLQRSLGHLPEGVRAEVLKKVDLQDQIGDSIVVRGNTLTIKINVAEEGKKDPTGGKRVVVKH